VCIARDGNAKPPGMGSRRLLVSRSGTFANTESQTC